MTGDHSELSGHLLITKLPTTPLRRPVLPLVLTIGGVENRMAVAKTQFILDIPQVSDLLVSILIPNPCKSLTIPVLPLSSGLFVEYVATWLGAIFPLGLTL